MLNFKQWSDNTQYLVLEDHLSFFIGMNGIRLHHIGDIANSLEEALNEDHAQVLGNLSIGRLESFSKLVTEIRWHLHPQQHGYRPRLSAHQNHFTEVSIHFRETNPPKTVIASQLNDHDIRGVLLNQSRQPHKTASRCITRNPSVDNPTSASCHSGFEKGHPAVPKVRQAIACTDAVTQNQKRGCPGRKNSQ